MYVLGTLESYFPFLDANDIYLCQNTLKLLLIYHFGTKGMYLRIKVHDIYIYIYMSLSSWKKIIPRCQGHIYICPYFLSTVNYLVSYIRMVMYTILAIANVFHIFPCLAPGKNRKFWLGSQRVKWHIFEKLPTWRLHNLRSSIPYFGAAIIRTYFKILCSFKNF